MSSRTVADLEKEAKRLARLDLERFRYGISYTEIARSCRPPVHRSLPSAVFAKPLPRARSEKVIETTKRLIAERKAQAAKGKNHAA